MIMLDVIEFQISVPTCQDFLPRFCRAALRDSDAVFMKTCQLLLDAVMMSPLYSSLPASLLASAAVFVSSSLFAVAASAGSMPELASLWTSTLLYYTEYKMDELLRPGKEMLEMFHVDDLNGVKTKYKSASQHSRLSLSKHLSDEVTKKTLDLLVMKS